MMRIQRRFIASAISMLAALSFSAGAFAQDAPPEKSTGKQGDVIFFEREVAGPGRGERIRAPEPGEPGGDDTLVFISSEMSFDSKVVKGAPYSAQAVTETTRTLADGNRIKRETSASVYRDSEGRTRRDQELGSVGPFSVAGDPRKTIFINDPVAGVHYVLDPRTRIARKMLPLRLSVSPDAAPVVAGPGGAQPKVRVRVEEDVFAAPVPGPPPGVEGAQMHDFHIMAMPDKGTTESLGKQTIEGVVAEGTRSTTTIPAGKIGNEQPIQIVWEKWYSPELQTIVMSKHSDPLVGETIYRLTNIVRSEPARTLFEVPSDYTLKEAPGPARMIRRKRAGDER